MVNNPGRQEEIITRTKNWIRSVVIGCNFCPFAAKEVKQDTIHYQVEDAVSVKYCLTALTNEFTRLDNDDSIVTTILIFPDAFELFNDYLDGISMAERLLKKQGYSGKYQLASFHPLYQFAGTMVDDVVNYTNKSLYPMIHILREAKITEALLKFPDPEGIPDRNIEFATKKGLAYMKMLRDNC